MTGPSEAGLKRARGVRPDTYLFFFVSFTLVVLLTHAAYFDLPYFWDEMGQFVPAALDIYHDGAWIPHSTVPNAHAPGVMAYLAGVWSAGAVTGRFGTLTQSDVGCQAIR